MTHKPTNNKYRPAKLPRPTIDPAIRKAATIISYLTPRQIADNSWVSPACARNLINGTTSRPQNLTIEGLLYAAGYKREIVKR